MKNEIVLDRHCDYVNSTVVVFFLSFRILVLVCVLVLVIVVVVVVVVVVASSPILPMYAQISQTSPSLPPPTFAISTAFCCRCNGRHRCPRRPCRMHRTRLSILSFPCLAPHDRNDIQGCPFFAAYDICCREGC